MKASPGLPHPKSAAAFFRPVVVGVVVLNLLVVGATVLSLYESRTRYDERATGLASNLAQVLDRYIDGVVDKVDLALLAVEDEAEKQLAAGAIDRAALNAFIVRQYERQPDIDGLRVTDSQGNVLYGAGADPSARALAAAGDDLVRLRADPGAGLVFSRPHLGRIDGRWVIRLARGIKRPDGSFGGIVYAPIAAEHFHKMFSAIDIGANGSITLRDGELGIVARYPPPQGLGSIVGNKEVSPEFRKLMAAGSMAGTFTVPAELDKIDRIFSYRRIAEHPLFIIVGVAKYDFLAPWWGEVVERFAYAGLFAVITLLWWWMFYRSWVHKAFTDRLEHQVEERTAELRALAIELTMAEERERQAIAQDLHDDLGQTLAISKLKLTSLDTPGACPHHDGLMRQIKEVETMIDQANRSVRSLSLQLSPPILHQFGLVPALEWLADEMHRNFGLNASISDDGEPKRLDAISGNMLFRSVRELLINVHKHAKVDTADVSILTNSEYLIISVTDTGAGFDAKKDVTPATGGGYGLFSVRERIRYFGGEMQIDSSPGDGTVVVLILPFGTTAIEARQ